MGFSGYWFYQLTPDKLKGKEVLNGFRSQVLDLGPSISYEWKMWSVPVSACLRYFKETHAKHYLKGESVYFTISLPLF